MSAITTHVLDTGRGRPAKGVPVALQLFIPLGRWKRVAQGVTDADGRARDLLPKAFKLKKGIYRLTFQTAGYFRSSSSLMRSGPLLPSGSP